MKEAYLIMCAYMYPVFIVVIIALVLYLVYLGVTDVNEWVTNKWDAYVRNKNNDESMET